MSKGNHQHPHCRHLVSCASISTASGDHCSGPYSDLRASNGYRKFQINTGSEVWRLELQSPPVRAFSLCFPEDAGVCF
ncbi:hypothetical protein RRG08_006563 [Elysia crispata]|uniref:Uncharacterized protein n=1 Tax=Elysia crispata TaxID=231223 RepID=A0AAE0Z8J5_9GAST|nr:hypothetical protein RRG08_006563 [Elysia crispata]